MLSVMLKCWYAESQQAYCHYAECYVAGCCDYVECRNTMSLGKVSS